MRAFLAALDAGADVLETDAHATADGIAVLAHDPTLDRVAGQDVVIERTMRAELQRIDLGQGETVPGLREALIKSRKQETGRDGERGGGMEGRRERGGGSERVWQCDQ